MNPKLPIEQRVDMAWQGLTADTIHSRSADLCPVAFSCFRAFSRGWDYVSSYDPLFHELSTFFLTVHYRRPAGVGRETKKFFFRAESTPSDSWTFSFVFSFSEADARARENFFEKMGFFS